MGYHDVSQICLNGHTITRNWGRSPQFRKNFCDRCGESTVAECQNCREHIRGEYHVEGLAVIGARIPPPPRFCHACGKPYPWTERRIAAAKELADEFDDLSAEERERLKDSVDDLVSGGPRTEIAAVRFKKLMGKIGAGSYTVMKDILVSIISEVGKKALFD